MERRQTESAAEQARLVVVIGNTTTTMAMFSEGPEPDVARMPSDRVESSDLITGVLGELVRQHGAPHDIAICSVVPDIARRCASLFESMFSVPVLVIGADIRLPFNLEYGNRNAFGADRVALCAWSRKIFSGQAHIAVDIGTAITFDVLDSNGNHVGGLIMPGLDMMAGALHARTAQLPQVNIERSSTLLGRSTEECIRSGIFWGTVKQISGLIDEIGDYLRREHGEATVRVIATGGNSRLIAAEIESIDVVDEVAVARGSRLLLELNSSPD
ncbi:MAG: type III pantothenate kinase [Chlorobiaceae bacterium]|nr:type III pantothenate kinase [Chlorobiaceae bacterium]